MLVSFPDFEKQHLKRRRIAEFIKHTDTYSKLASKKQFLHIHEAFGTIDASLRLL
jgi:hypothetical protein